VKSTVLAVALAACPVAASAAKWTQTPGEPATYFDMESVHKENFHASAGGPEKSLTIAWVALTDEKSNIYAQIEVAYDCHGKMSAIQQIIYGETKDSAFHSFDYTHIFKLTGVQLKSIAPDSPYDKAQSLVCKSGLPPFNDLGRPAWLNRSRAWTKYLGGGSDLAIATAACKVLC
jgi:hypothetical protein